MSPIPDELTATVISVVDSLSALQKAKVELIDLTQIWKRGRRLPGRLSENPESAKGRCREGLGCERQGAEGCSAETLVDGVSRSVTSFSRANSVDSVLTSLPFLPLCTQRVVDFQTASTFDPSNQELQFYWRREPVVRLSYL